MQLRNVLAMTRKEARTMRHDHALLSSILVQPVLYLILFGLAITNEVNHAAWIVYDQSQTAHSRQLITDLSALTALQAPQFAHEEVGVRPRRLARGQDAPIQILLNGARTASALRVANYINQTATAFSLTHLPARDRSEQRLTTAQVSIEKRYWYNPGLQDRFGLLSAMPANMLTQICLMIAAISLVAERERGTFEQLLATPLSLSEIMLGKMIPYVGIGFIALSMMLTGSYVFYGIAVKGSLLLLMLVALVFMFATMAFGIFFSAWAQNVQQYHVRAQCAGVPFSNRNFHLAGWGQIQGHQDGPRLCLV